MNAYAFNNKFLTFGFDPYLLTTDIKPTNITTLMPNRHNYASLRAKPGLNFDTRHFLSVLSNNILICCHGNLSAHFLLHSSIHTCNTMHTEKERNTSVSSVNYHINLTPETVMYSFPSFFGSCFFFIHVSLFINWLQNLIWTLHSLINTFLLNTLATVQRYTY